MIERFIAAILLVTTSPLLLLVFILVRLSSKGPFFYKQVRIGKNFKSFTIYKIRTMKIGADLIKDQLQNLNEADGPVFKIYNDPRYTSIGKFLSHTGLDELPQLINIVKGEMAFVGPRPLPVDEAQLIPKKYSLRFTVLPGITSTWVINGSHKLTFTQWMQLDLQYVKNKNIYLDIFIGIKTILLIVRSLFIKSFLDNSI